MFCPRYTALLSIISGPSVTKEIAFTSNRTVKTSNESWVERDAQNGIHKQLDNEGFQRAKVRLLVQKQEIIVERYA